MEQENVVALRTDVPDLRGRLKAVMDTDRRITQARLAKECGLSATTISQWLGGTYPGDNAGIEAKLERWIVQLRQQQSTQAMLPAPPGYVGTPTAERVMAALQYAQLAGDIAVIYGGAGLGKTTAIARYSEGALNCWVVTMHEDCSSMVTAMEEVAEAVGAANAGTGAARLRRAVVKKVAGTGGLLVIDEAQHLGVAALDEVRGIHDATGIGIALVGNEQVYARITGGNRAAYLDRLYSRIGKQVSLKQSQPADIEALLKAWGIEERECRGQLVEIAKRPGALRGLTKVLRLASMRAAAAGRALCCTDVRAAAAELGVES